MKLQVIICTHNPRMKMFNKTLESLYNQSLDKSHWDILIVDNKSSTVLSEKIPKDDSNFIRVIREDKLGLVYARSTGIANATGDVIIFVDDDNILALDFMEVIYNIFMSDETLGIACGVVEPLYQSPPPSWLYPLENHLAIFALGTQQKTLQYPEKLEWEPVGAGLAVKRDAAADFLEYTKSGSIPDGLGRKGNTLHGCEDSLLVHVIYKNKYKIIYTPKLRLQHYIPVHRTSFLYHLRLAYSLGVSHAILRDILNVSVKKYNKLILYIFLIYHLFRLDESCIRVRLVKWVWMAGYTLRSSSLWKPMGL